MSTVVQQRIPMSDVKGVRILVEPRFKQCSEILNKLHPELEVSKSGCVRFSATHEIIIPAPDQGGYLRVQAVSVHRCVLETFCPKPKCGIKLECDHRNARQLCNFFSNLRWVSRELNAVFQHHKGYSIRYTKKGVPRYRTKFRKKSYGTFGTPLEARDRYEEVRGAWIAQERKRIVDSVMEKNSCTKMTAFALLNWDLRDVYDVS